MADQPALSTISRGATLTHFLVPCGPPDENGMREKKNICLSLPHASLYATHPHPHFGETIGRIGNRIKGGELKNLNGRDYRLATNENGQNCLHGGEVGWGAKEWQRLGFVRKGKWDAGIRSVTPLGWVEPAKGEDGNASDEREGVGYELVSRDGDENFPGTVVARVWYFEGRGEKDEVVMDMEWECDFPQTPPPRLEGMHENGTATNGSRESAQETVVSMTNHAYFNLDLEPETVGSPNSSPEGSPERRRSQDGPVAEKDRKTIRNHSMTLAYPRCIATSETDAGIPTGEILPHHPLVPAKPDTPFALAPPEPGRDEPAYLDIDACFVTPQEPAEVPLDTRAQPLQPLCTLTSGASRICLAVASTEPAFQVYTGAAVDVPAWEGRVGMDGARWPAGRGWGSHAGVAIEPGRYIGAVGEGREEWRGMVKMRRGEKAGGRSRYVAWWQGE